jgi:hypothetical protein
MDRGGYARTLLGATIGLGGLGIVAAVATGHDAYVSGIAAVVCLTNGVVLTYVNRTEDVDD